LEEGASLARRMAEKAARGNHPHLEHRYRDRAHAKKEQAEILRKLILETQDAPIEMEKTAS
jgi:hypothetical protein